MHLSHPSPTSEEEGVIQPNRSFVTIPILIVILSLACVVLAVSLLSMKISLPIGPMYWDSVIYYDAINRMEHGQVPLVDFNIPVGPLIFWLAYGAYQFFPNAQPVLLIHWSLMLFSLPLITVLCINIAKQNIQNANLWAQSLLLPFLLFSLLPWGTVSYHSYPGSEGFGYYNRHGALMLYVLTSAVFFIKKPTYQIAFLCLCGAILFLIKVTAFISGVMIVGFAFLAGFISFPTLLLAFSGFLLLILGLQLTTGTMLPYILTIWDLASSNQGSILSRFPTAISEHLDIVLATLLLSLVLLITQFAGRPQSNVRFDPYAQKGIFNKISKFLSHDFILIGIVLVAGIFFETQNTGSQAFIMLWPIILLALYHQYHVIAPYRTMILILAMAAALPTITKISHKGLRTFATYPTFQAFENENLGPLGQVLGKTHMVQSLEPMRDFYIATKDAHAVLARKDFLPDYTLFTESTFHMSWLIEVNRAIAAIHAYESENKVRFETIHNLNLANPFAFLMDRKAPKFTQIAADPSRTLGTVTDKIKSEIANTDLILRLACPILANSERLYGIYAPIIEQTHEQFKLNECYIGYKKRQ